jgi:multiple sugar transport system substrate-binding protein
VPSKFDRKKISRREALSTAAKVAVGVVVAGVVGGVAGYYAGSTTRPPSVKTEIVTKTVISTQTVTQTVTATPIITTTTPTMTTTTTPTITVTTTVPTPTIMGPVTMYFEKGWYPEEDEAKKLLVERFKKEKGITIDLSLFAEEDAHKKTVAGCMAGTPPEIAFVRMWDWLGQDLAWKGWLEDVSELIDVAKEIEIFDWALEAAYLWDSVEGRRKYCFVPFAIDSVHFSYWKDLLTEAGMPTEPDEIPMKFDEFTNFWREAQDRLWKRRPDYKEKVYGIGWPSLGGIGVNPGDGWAQIAHIMCWYGWDPIKPEGFVLDTPENIQAFKSAVKWVVEQYQAGYMPKGILEWASPDNNKAFHAKQIISVFNASMSIPLYWYSTDKTAYFELSASLPRMPSVQGGRGLNLWHTFGWYIFKDARYKDLAKQFVKWFLQPEILNFYMKAAGGRMFPASKMVLEMDPYWKKGKEVIDGKKDPHLPTVYQRLMEGPNKPFIHQRLGYPPHIIDCPPLVACQKVITGGYSIDEAVKEAINTWKELLKPYEEKIKTFKK